MPGTLTCPTCDKPMVIARTKAMKPMAKCRPCGIQLFIRDGGAIATFTERFGDAWKAAPIDASASPAAEPVRAAPKPAAATKSVRTTKPTPSPEKKPDVEEGAPKPQPAPAAAAPAKPKSDSFWDRL